MGLGLIRGVFFKGAWDVCLGRWYLNSELRKKHNRKLNILPYATLPHPERRDEGKCSTAVVAVLIPIVVW